MFFRIATLTSYTQTDNFTLFFSFQNDILTKDYVTTSITELFLFLIPVYFFFHQKNRTAATTRSNFPKERKNRVMKNIVQKKKKKNAKHAMTI